MAQNRVFMVAARDDTDYAVFAMSGKVLRFDDWEGTRFASRRAAEHVMGFAGLAGEYRVVEVLDEISVRIPASA